MKQFLALLTILSGNLFCQSIIAPASTVNGVPASNLITVCSVNPGSGTCAGGNLVTTYTTISLTTACSGTGGPLSGTGCTNPGNSDSAGNIIAFAAAGQYWCQYKASSTAVASSRPCTAAGTGAAQSVLNLTGVGEAIPNGGGDGSNVLLYMQPDSVVDPYPIVTRVSSDPTTTFGFWNQLPNGKLEIGATAGAIYQFITFDPIAQSITLNPSGPSATISIPGAISSTLSIQNTNPQFDMQIVPASSTAEGFVMTTSVGSPGCGDLAFSPHSPSGGSVGGCIGFNNRNNNAALFIEGTASSTRLLISSDGSNNISFVGGSAAKADLHSFTLHAPALSMENGTQFTASGCSNSTLVGGSSVGSYTSGTTGTCTVTITIGGGSPITAIHGWACYANDLTTPTDVQHQTTPISTTQATITGTTVSGDVINFGCTGY